MRYLIPIASKDDLFPKDEYHFPKPLIEVDGAPMISLVVNSIRNRDASARFIFIVLHQDALEYSLDQILKLLAGPSTTVIELNNPTMGAVCSALMAVDHIGDDEPLVICNGDQIIDADLSGIARDFVRSGADAGVVTFDSVHPRWSYIRENGRGEVIETAEKRVLSRKAIAGYYYFRSGNLFIEKAQTYLLKADPLGGKYYLSPVLNEVVLSGGRIVQHEIPSDNYISFYSPKRIEFYQNELRGKVAVLAKPSRSVQVVIPMAGLGSRFAKVGYSKPKPFIDVKGKTMIERVMDNLRLDHARFVLIARQEHLDAEPDVVDGLKERGDLVFSPIDFVTEGAACTVLTARHHFDPDAPLLIANCDQIVDFDCADYLYDAIERDLDGSILCFKDRDRDPKWSFAHVNDEGLVDEVKEKVPISDNATVGIYYFRRARDFIDAATDMIAHNDRSNNEFYVCPVYNYLIRQGGRIGVYHIAPDAMHGIGTPPDLEAYLELI
ncbi:glycosyltransferase family 2 protein [Allorhizobium taibaishanense]|uniref:NDP-sugar pyrophosphorylase family protein n=1 Tax=Allorhizobium taibaishanense TaxID=887144 RepID=A0A1Q9A724_9HYPH|nr:glycosyltransferase family 2 protein [Allorhizobium taibaishanense]MBB4008449.1 NDP-sugar pyrophosphorylase family protein [Allorhizobium taibaishanense]OLP50382.1 nucleotidyl transferase [Allorhizobium taibaishanense]